MISKEESIVILVTLFSKKRFYLVKTQLFGSYENFFLYRQDGFVASLPIGFVTFSYNKAFPYFCSLMFRFHSQFFCISLIFYIINYNCFFHIFTHLVFFDLKFAFFLLLFFLNF
jgi:hypothetical protein